MSEQVRAYLPRGRVAHVLPLWASLNDTVPALCGVRPPVFSGGSWYGSGTWDESEKLSALATCLNCERALRRPDSDAPLTYQPWSSPESTPLDDLRTWSRGLLPSDACDVFGDEEG